MDKLARNAGDFLAAERLTLLPWGGERIGMAICYEVVYPAEVADLARAGATLLVTITNDAWYGDTAAPWQHFRAARFRAAENRRPLLRAAITGVSALVAPDGSVQAQIGVFKEGVIRGWVIGRTRLTPYARLPWLFPLLSTAVAAFAVYLSRRRRP
jgi:apolipoprotein N-acyltransferase